MFLTLFDTDKVEKIWNKRMSTHHIIQMKTEIETSYLK